MFNYDNTASVHAFASSPEAQRIINQNTSGSEKQVFSIGQKVNSTSVAPVSIQNGTIIDCYNQNGFYYYVVEYKVKRKAYTYTMRTKDIEGVK